MPVIETMNRTSKVRQQFLPNATRDLDFWEVTEQTFGSAEGFEDFILERVFYGAYISPTQARWLYEHRNMNVEQSFIWEGTSSW